MDNDVLFTEHALTMLKERKFTMEFIKEIVLNPDYKEPSNNELWSAIKKVEEKVMRVVVKGEQKPYTVITMYYDRRLRKTMMAEERRTQNES